MGIDVVYLFTDFLGVRSGLGLTQKGYSLKSTETIDIFGISSTIDMEASDAYNYLSIPVLAHLMFGDGIRIYCNAGPVFNVWMSGVSKSTTTTTVEGLPAETETTDEKITDGTESLEISLQAGLGVLYTIVEGRRKPTLSVSAEAGYNMGLTDIIKDFKHKSSGIYFGVGLLVGGIL